jgi:hypothetical protein
MLRLKPSELTLTPEDVDDALYRMARRQQSRASAATAQRRVRYSGRPPSPRLTPGAQRSVASVISGDVSIPIRSRPQHAIIEHVADDSEDSSESLRRPSTPASMRGGASNRAHAADLVPRAPYTEPSQKTSQRQVRQRSYSSSDATPSRLFRPRQHSSEASNTSLAYSVYQLPESRQPSGGAYHSVRLSDAQALADNGTHVSPLEPATVHFTTAALSRPSPLDAIIAYAEREARVSHLESDTAHITAATLRRASPLDALIAYTEREAQRLRNHEVHLQRNARVGGTHPVVSNSRNRWTSPGPYQFTHSPPPQMTMADDPYTRGVSAVQPRGSTPRSGRSRHTQAAPPSYPRINQRSSENAPVPIGQPIRASQVREQVSAFEQTHNTHQPR